jgi:hypothetical protein
MKQPKYFIWFSDQELNKEIDKLLWRSNDQISYFGLIFCTSYLYKEKIIILLKFKCRPDYEII